MSESNFVKTQMRSKNTSCEVYNYFMIVVCFNLFYSYQAYMYIENAQLQNQSHQLMKIKRSKIYNNLQSIMVMMKSTIINFKQYT
jgi:hypothetical protein